MTTIQIRPATMDDLDAVASLFDLYRQFYQQPCNLSLAAKFISDRLERNESVILLAMTDRQQACGFCQLYPSFCSIEAKAIYVLYDLFVTPHARRSGAGKLLLRAAEKLAGENGKSRLDLTTAKTNSAAQALYESLGWVKNDFFYAYGKRV